MRLRQWAAEQGVHYQTAWQWCRDGKMPVPVIQTATGQWLVQPAEAVPAIPGRVVGYCRVSSADQRDDLERQAGRVAIAAMEAGVPCEKIVTEVGSGLNGKRPKLSRLLSDPTVSVIVVEHRDRLARFGVEYIEAALAARGARLHVLNMDEVADDLVRDVTEVLTSMCARLYGRRSAARRAQAAVEAASAAPEAVT